MGERLGEKILQQYREWEWNVYKKKKRSRIKDTDFSIIASNCCGTFVYYDMGLPYLSPTINLSMGMDDFVKFAGNLKWYLDQKFVEAERKENCPVGLLGDIKIDFIHYETFEEGVQKWEERKQRINWDNLFIMGVEKDGCTYETIQQFDALPYENKVIFTHKKYPEFSAAYYIKGFEERNELGVITFYKKQLLKRRYMDDFNYVNFLNHEGIKI